MVRQQRKIGEFGRVKLGKPEIVTEHNRTYDVKPKLDKRVEENIKHGKAKRLKYPADPDFKYYFGTSSQKTFEVIDSYNDEDNQLGVCVNIYNYNKSLLNKVNKLEKLETPIFVDNGSFERFTAFLNYVKNTKRGHKIPPEEYFSYEKSDEYFQQTTENYKDLMKQSEIPENLIITIPEVIGNSELTQKLQKKYLNDYKKLEKDHKCKLIVSLQFNPNSEEWDKELEQGAKFISRNFPKEWIIGIPFGNDFTIIQNQKNFKKVEKIFDTHLKGREAHLFACGSPTKLENFAIPNDDFIYSVDASSVMNWSKFSHYFYNRQGRVMDIRDLQGTRKNISEEDVKAKREEFEEMSGISWKDWVAKKQEDPENYMPYIEKFDINTENITEYYNLGEKQEEE